LWRIWQDSNDWQRCGQADDRLLGFRRSQRRHLDGIRSTSFVVMVRAQPPSSPVVVESLLSNQAQRTKLNRTVAATLFVFVWYLFAGVAKRLCIFSFGDAPGRAKIASPRPANAPSDILLKIPRAYLLSMPAAFASANRFPCVVTAAPDLIPPPLIQQLKASRKLVIPAGLPDAQTPILAT
jgi:hypothetical protein